MRSALCLVVGSLCFMGCGIGGPHNPVSQSTAVASALAEIVKLDQYRAETSSTPVVTGFVLQSARLTSDTSSVTDSQGNVLTVNPAPGQAWVVEFSAPPQSIWTSVSALAEVDSMTGVVRGTGLWPVPANRPTKGYGGAG
ncbi:MAG TPA: hypothetical protein VNY77_01745 [Candidatus Angelobacter sp.]|jgi:hypothetical protein|nr:hypothetical protein [Candidatus Angelobacter sp.]